MENNINSLIDNFELSMDDFIVITGNFNNFILSQKRLNKDFDLNFLLTK